MIDGEGVVRHDGAGVIDGDAIVSELESRRAAGDRGDALLAAAVRMIAASGEAYDWVGVYGLEDDELVLREYVGAPTDHTRIPVGRGVCGTAVAENRNLNVPDVHAIDNYLACSVETASELVVLIRRPDGSIAGQLDLDSHRRAAFGERDERELKKVADWLGGHL